MMRCRRALSCQMPRELRTTLGIRVHAVVPLYLLEDPLRVVTLAVALRNTMADNAPTHTWMLAMLIDGAGADGLFFEITLEWTSFAITSAGGFGFAR